MTYLEIIDKIRNATKLFSISKNDIADAFEYLRGWINDANNAIDIADANAAAAVYSVEALNNKLFEVGTILESPSMNIPMDIHTILKLDITQNVDITITNLVARKISVIVSISGGAVMNFLNANAVLGSQAGKKVLLEIISDENNVYIISTILEP